jgi:hypothetical protein
MPPRSRFVFVLALICSPLPLVSLHAAETHIRLAAGPPADKQPEAGKNADNEDGKEELSPEQKMQKRFPQAVRVGHLVGLPVLDDGDSTIGYVREVVRTGEGKILLIVPYSPWLGWARTERGKRLVAVPIETVAILANQIIALDMPRTEFDEADTWDPADGTILSAEEKTPVALGRR